MLSLAVTSSHLLINNKVFIIFLLEKSLNNVFTIIISCDLDVKPCIDQSKSIPSCVHHINIYLSKILIWIQAFNYSPGVEIVNSDEM